MMSETTDPDHVDIFEILSACHHPFERPGESGPHHYNWVEEIMNSNVKTVTPDIDVTEVAKIIHRNHYHRIPVVEGKKVVGMISTIDLVGILARQEPWTSR